MINVHNLLGNSKNAFKPSVKKGFLETVELCQTLFQGQTAYFTSF